MLRGKRTLKEVNEATGISITHIHNVETGKKNVTLKDLAALLNFYGYELQIKFVPKEATYE
jgi:transcriptional regulator with XRE-family HTH domain